MDMNDFFPSLRGSHETLVCEVNRLENNATDNAGASDSCVHRGSFIVGETNGNRPAQTNNRRRDCEHQGIQDRKGPGSRYRHKFWGGGGLGDSGFNICDIARGGGGGLRDLGEER